MEQPKHPELPLRRLWQEQRDAEQARRERIPAELQSIAASLNEALAAAGIEYRVEPSEPTS